MASRPIIALNTTTPQLLAPQTAAGDDYSADSAINIVLGTVTATVKPLNITVTWNNAGVTFPGAIFINVTDTASNAASLLMDLQVGGTTKVKIDKTGKIYTNTSYVYSDGVSAMDVAFNASKVIRQDGTNITLFGQNLISGTDNTYDIGASGASRFRNAYLSGKLTVADAASFLTTSVALTNGAGVGAGTLTTAPSAGNPTKWIGINDNGTVRYIPAW